MHECMKEWMDEFILRADVLLNLPRVAMNYKKLR